jgi:hypothetical protein
LTRACRARRRFWELDALLDEDSPLLRKQLYGWLAERLDALADSTNGSQALLQAAMLEPDFEAHLLRICEMLVDSLDGYLTNVPYRPGPEHEPARYCWRSPAPGALTAR